MKPMNSLSRLVAVAFAAVAASTPVWAHDDATLDTMKAPNGGQLRAAGPHHYELVVAPAGSKGDTVTVYVTDHGGKPIATTGATGSATLLSGGKKTTVKLEPVAPNLMRGKGEYAATTNLKAVVSITLPGQPAGQARFAPMAPKGDEHAGHKH
jgi:hypothetical protein